MPRTLARLRYRPKPPQIPFPRIEASKPLPKPGLLKQQITSYVLQQQRPRHIRLQVLVNDQARRQPTGKTVKRIDKPFTLRDLVDPEGKAQHGEIIYVFCHSETNQIIYSLQELLDNHHLEQLPFIGRHSKPPVVRPDKWLPHCVITFPTPKQGHNAFRKLREFRHLHELAWDKCNPEYKNLPLKMRMRKIMNQRANMSADLAAVLSDQGAHGTRMAKELEAQEERTAKYLEQRWPSASALAADETISEKPTDNAQWLEGQVESMDKKLKMKKNQDPADQRRILAARKSLQKRLFKVQYALKKREDAKAFQKDMTIKAAPANEEGAEARLEELQAQALLLQRALESSDPTGTPAELATNTDLLSQTQSDIASLEAAFVAKARLRTGNSETDRIALPRHFRKVSGTPYTLEGVQVRWKDLRDALYARGQWPEAIEHETLALNPVHENILFLSADEYKIETRNEVGRIVEAIREEKERLDEEARPEAEKEARRRARRTSGGTSGGMSGLAKYLPTTPKPSSKRATA